MDEQLDRAADEVEPRRGPHAIEAHDLGEERKTRWIGRGGEAKQAREVRPAQRVITRVVKVAEPHRVPVDRLDANSGLRMLPSVVGSDGVR